MDFDKYYKIDTDGFYNLHFVNKDRLGLVEIKKIFSSYGNVFVNFTKDQGGFVFIRYKSLEETVSCLKGLKNSNIQILLERTKINNNSNKKPDKRDLSQQQAAAIGNSFQNTFNDSEQLNSSTHDKNFGENSTHRRTSNEVNGHNSSDTIRKPNLNVTRASESNSSFYKKSLPSGQQTLETNSSDTMDYEKYYRTSKDESYNIHFVNKKDLTMEQVNERFSQYGNVLSSNFGGDGKKLVFIKYKTLEETIKCLKDLQNSDISILPQKDKIMEMKTADRKSSNQASRKEDTSQGSLIKRTHNGSSIYSEKFPENGGKPIQNMKTSELDKLKDNDNFSDTVSHSSKQDKFKEDETKYKNTNPQMSSEKYSYSRQSLMNNKDYIQIMREKQQKTKLCPSVKSETDIKIDRNTQSSTYDYKIPALISDIDIMSNESDSLWSDTSLSNGTKNSSSKIVIVMQEIIVANIHPNYGVHYILHLFDKYDPISATFVKTIPENHVRYCHVYFKSVQDAKAVEEEFDNFDLAGKNLIVLRKSRLVDKTI